MNSLTCGGRVQGTPAGEEPTIIKTGVIEQKKFGKRANLYSIWLLEGAYSHILFCCKYDQRLSHQLWDCRIISKNRCDILVKELLVPVAVVDGIDVDGNTGSVQCMDQCIIGKGIAGVVSVSLQILQVSQQLRRMTVILQGTDGNSAVQSFTLVQVIMIKG